MSIGKINWKAARWNSRQRPRDLPAGTCKWSKEGLKRNCVPRGKGVLGSGQLYLPSFCFSFSRDGEFVQVGQLMNGQERQPRKRRNPWARKATDWWTKSGWVGWKQFTSYSTRRELSIVGFSPGKKLMLCIFLQKYLWDVKENERAALRSGFTSQSSTWCEWF